MLFNHDGGMMKKCAYVPGGVARGYKNIQGHWLHMSPAFIFLCERSVCDIVG